jgi:hypothetical protein
MRASSLIPDKVTPFPSLESEAQKMLKLYIPLSEANGLANLAACKNKRGVE